MFGPSSDSFHDLKNIGPNAWGGNTNTSTNQSQSVNNTATTFDMDQVDGFNSFVDAEEQNEQATKGQGKSQNPFIARVVKSDIKCKNGYIHIIDKPIAAPANTSIVLQMAGLDMFFETLRIANIVHKFDK